MASLWFCFSVRDNSAAGLGVRVIGLTPTWTLFKSLDTGADVLPQPVIVEVGQGIYKYAYDPDLYGDAAAQVDALGGSNPLGLPLSPSDRYIDAFPTRDPSPALAGTTASDQVQVTAAAENLGEIITVTVSFPVAMIGLPSGTTALASAYFPATYFPNDYFPSGTSSPVPGPGTGPAGRR